MIIENVNEVVKFSTRHGCHLSTKSAFHKAWASIGRYAWSSGVRKWIKGQSLIESLESVAWVHWYFRYSKQKGLWFYRDDDNRAPVHFHQMTMHGRRNKTDVNHLGRKLHFEGICRGSVNETEESGWSSSGFNLVWSAIAEYSTEFAVFQIFWVQNLGIQDDRGGVRPPYVPGKGLRSSPLYCGSNAHLRVLSSWSNHLPKIPPPHTITSGFNTSTYKF